MAAALAGFAVWNAPVLRALGTLCAGDAGALGASVLFAGRGLRGAATGPDGTVWLAALLILPLLGEQLLALINSAPKLVDQLQRFLTKHFPQILDQHSVVHQTLVSIGETIKSQGGKLANNVLTSAMTVVSAVVFILVAPVVALYMLPDGARKVAQTDAGTPPQHRPVMRSRAAATAARRSGGVPGPRHMG